MPWPGGRCEMALRKREFHMTSMPQRLATFVALISRHRGLPRFSRILKLHQCTEFGLAVKMYVIDVALTISQQTGSSQRQSMDLLRHLAIANDRTNRQREECSC